eukprot:1151616-Pelagomonas_calceolata.AAC.3
MHTCKKRTQSQRQLQLSLEAHGRYLATLIEQEARGGGSSQSLAQQLVGPMGSIARAACSPLCGGAGQREILRQLRRLLPAPGRPSVQSCVSRWCILSSPTPCLLWCHGHEVVTEGCVVTV